MFGCFGAFDTNINGVWDDLGTIIHYSIITIWDCKEYYDITCRVLDPYIVGQEQHGQLCSQLLSSADPQLLPDFSTLWQSLP